MSLFSGLEFLGFTKLSEVKVYDDDNKGQAKKSDNKSTDAEQIVESDFIFDKTVRCPVCDREFKTKTVKTGKIKLLSTDMDLRPKYQYVDSLKYDAIACPTCGYAALSRYFKYLTSVQCKLIKEKISATFKGFAKEGDIITYDEAIIKYKLALINAIVKRAKLSERAYTCLKIGWLYRGKAESLPKDTKDYAQVLKKLKEEEQEFLSNSYKGFVDAFSKESFPMCGMDENTTTYLVAALARQIENFDDSMRWISKVITSRSANERVKTKARDLKECVTKEKKEKEEKEKKAGGAR